ncbi:MAG: hypothetical protein NUW37_18500 [Planctomycetes bacterium]|nr:hypothetical protein [Planctomycetota bacterium]
MHTLRNSIFFVVFALLLFTCLFFSGHIRAEDDPFLNENPSLIEDERASLFYDPKSETHSSLIATLFLRDYRASGYTFGREWSREDSLRTRNIISRNYRPVSPGYPVYMNEPPPRGDQGIDAPFDCADIIMCIDPETGKDSFSSVHKFVLDAEGTSSNTGKPCYETLIHKYDFLFLSEKYHLNGRYPRSMECDLFWLIRNDSADSDDAPIFNVSLANQSRAGQRFDEAYDVFNEELHLSRRNDGKRTCVPIILDDIYILKVPVCPQNIKSGALLIKIVMIVILEYREGESVTFRWRELWSNRIT